MKKNNFILKRIRFLVYFLVIFLTVISCSGDDNLNPKPDSIHEPEEQSFDINSITDTYYDLAPFENVYQWGVYNVHDPSVIKSGDTYYCFNTDVGFGIEVRPGIQIRKSKDLIEWEFVGWVFNSLPEKGSQFIRLNGDNPFNSLWAPCVIKTNNEYRLYYSLSSNTPRLSVIGLAKASSPLGPWTEKEIVVSSKNDGIIQTNAIDPTVVVDKIGQHWMFYGSAWDGIYKLKLDSSTGLALSPGDKGERVAQRGFTGATINGNIEGAEVIYNEEFDKYYMFISYDWLQTKYNVRVGRSDSVEGPYYDINGEDINRETDNEPMILAPYQFKGHSGWQGVSHPGIFNNSNGQYYIAHQGRPGENSYFMVLHVRKIFWTEDGWPIISPERYAGVNQTNIISTDLVGNYEQIILGYNVVPGFGDKQTSPDFQTSINLELNSNGSINGDSNNQWEFQPPWLILTWGNSWVDKLYVERGRDWENKVDSTILLSGLNNEGTAIWGKKID